MIDPLHCARLILNNAPEQATALLDLILWVRATQGAVMGAQFEKLKEFVHAHTPDATSHREQYEASRLAASDQSPVIG